MNDGRVGQGNMDNGASEMESRCTVGASNSPLPPPMIADHAAHNSYHTNCACPNCHEKEGVVARAFKWCGLTVLKAVVGIVLLYGLLIGFSMVVFFFMGFSQKGKAKTDSWLVMKLPAGLTEAPRDSGLMESIGGKKTSPTLYTTMESIRQAADDSKIKGIVIDLDNWAVGAAHTDEVIRVFREFQKSGKKIYAYGTMIHNANYRVAAAADSIVMPPSSSCMFSLTGFSRTLPYYKGLADKFGIKVNVIHIGKFKAFGENYTKSKMSEELKQELLKVYEPMYDHFVEQLIKGRGKKIKGDLNAMILRGELAMVEPKQALKLGLIDKLMFKDELLSSLKGDEEEVSQISLETYASDLSLSGSGDKIAVIFAEGDIMPSPSSESAFGSDKTINPRGIQNALDAIEAEGDVKALVLRVNSPGGSALASELILNKLKKLQKKMPIVVSMGPVAASGGYYISSNANKIFAEQSTITGSIGVVSLLPQFSTLTKKLGVNFQTITVKNAKHADSGNLAKKDLSEEIALLRKSMRNIYREFKAHVSEGRKIKDSELEKIAQGKIWTGPQAVKIGLVDEIGGLDSAIKAAADMVKLKDYQLMMLPKEKSFFEELATVNTKSPGVIEAMSEVDELKGMIQMYKLAKLYQRKPLMLMPFSPQLLEGR